MMTLYDKIVALYPELTEADFTSPRATICLENASDGKGDYIKSWEHPTLPRPTQAQLDGVQ